MKLMLTLATDKGQFVTQAVVNFPESDLELPPTEFSFRNCLFNKAIETLQADARFETAMKRYGGIMPQGVC